MVLLLLYLVLSVIDSSFEGSLAWEGDPILEVVLLSDISVKLLNGLFIEFLELLEPHDDLILEVDLRRHWVAVDR